MHTSFCITNRTVSEFIEHWSSRYIDGDRDKIFYDPFIGKADLKTDFAALESLFIWKNGTKIAPLKQRSIVVNYFNNWVDDAELESHFLHGKSSGGPIWNIFYLHCRLPSVWPIYDQHTYRAMQYLKNGNIVGDVNAFPKPKIYKTYLNEYVPFATELSSDRRSTDRALYTFGQFLKLAAPYVADLVVPGPA